jgi:hypothetical protein
MITVKHFTLRYFSSTAAHGLDVESGAPPGRASKIPLMQRKSLFRTPDQE